ncbi:hypothetical protein [Terasakiella sp. SH-1]|uniref:hypothetical protein n=1 Tax=Terasakiella sp. SH-1 TaxID=2560057 RepID=UPI0010740E12|nr:hypothetical protein [Terasakiella sp. SH-1]
MDLSQRRNLIKTQDNPNKAIDYLVSLKGQCPQAKRHLTLRYAPDRLIMERNCFQNYMVALFADANLPIETIANTLLEDINNELVARWVQVKVSEDFDEANQHFVIVEDQQPQWDNPHFMARLSKV